ncbi:MAG: MBL fold metallo-hydrolase [Oscillospiraceae bacterium]|nr:MBL fold metallo-hydrolase [Oscillospiraceae bacterium]
MKFIALGAANSVGASCYFLQAGGRNFLLDCGKGIIGQKTHGPDLTYLSSAAGLFSLAQLDAIFISHGHYDHIGYLPEITRKCPDTPVYATQMTKKLARYLMLDNSFAYADRSLEQKIGAEFDTASALTRIQTQDYFQPVQIGSVKFTFYEAGHVPGAAMIYVESDEGSLLYTGDFRRASSRLTGGYLLPGNLCPDTLLLCGLHAKHPGYIISDALNVLAGRVNGAVQENEPCLIVTRELTKGIEIVSFLVEKMQARQMNSMPIFIDDNIWQLNKRMQEAGVSVLSEHCRRFPNLSRESVPPGIYVGAKRWGSYFRHVFDTRFSLHADYEECSDLIRRTRPAQIILVHSPDDTYGNGNTALEEEFPASTFIYPAIGQPYLTARQGG